MKISLLRFRTMIMILVFIPGILLTGVKAQESQSFFGIKSGASFPLLNYKSTSLEDGSFAITGYHVTVEGAWFFKPRLGIGASAALQQHPVDVSLLGWEKVQADAFLEDLYIRSDPYLLLTGMAGLYYRYPIINKLNLEVKLLGGILYGRTPYQLYKPKYFLSGPEYYEITSARDWNFTGNVGVGIQYDLTPCYSLVLDTDWIYSNLAFSFNSATGTRIDKRTIAYMNLSLGLRIKL